MKRILYPKGTDVSVTNNVVQVTIPFSKFSAKEVEELKQNAKILQDIVQTGLHMMSEKINIVSADRTQNYPIKPQTLEVQILKNSIVQKAELDVRTP